MEEPFHILDYQLQMYVILNVVIAYQMAIKKIKVTIELFLAYEEIGRLAKGLSELGVCKIRLTGGEPTVRKDFFDIVKIIKSNSGIKKNSNYYKWLSFRSKLLIKLLIVA